MNRTGALSFVAVLKWNTKDWTVIAGFTLLINLLMLVPTLYMLQIYDRVMISGSTLTLVAVSLLVLFLFGLMTAADWFRSRLLIRLGQLMDHRLAPLVFQATYRERLQGQAETAAQRLTDLTQVRQFMTGSGFLNVMDMPWMPIYVGVLFLLHPMLGGFAVIFAVLQWGLTALSNRHSRKDAQASEASQKSVDQLTTQFRRLGAVVSTMGMGAAARTQWGSAQSLARESQEQASARQARWSALSKWLRYTQQSASLGLGAWLAIRGEITVGAMIAANVLATRALAPIDGWAQARPAALAAREALLRLAKLLDTESTQPEIQTFLDPTPKGHDTSTMVALEQVEVRVEGRQLPLLCGIDLVCRRGEITVIQGASGSGKTTLLKVLLGIQPITKGRIFRSLDPAQHSDQVGYLPQAIELFNGTVAQNIARFAEPNGQAVIAAAQLTGLHETLQRMDKGYDTPVGPHGQALSGGQRQRIGLARAVYGMPSLIVLDEPNAQLDSAGESALYQALLQLRASGACIVVVSHRPGAADMADQTVHLDSGALISSHRPTQHHTAQAIA